MNFCVFAALQRVSFCLLLLCRSYGIALPYRKKLQKSYTICCVSSPLSPAGVWGVGLATSSVRLDNVPLGNDQLSWVLTSDGTTLHNNEVISRLKEKPAEGDILVKSI